ncbi:MAG: hypothetical protein ACTHLH_05755 [Solirubrobacterales bacterium]
MAYILFEFINKWIEGGRFPREELRIRWWIAVPGLLVLLALAAALVIAWLD